MTKPALKFVWTEQCQRIALLLDAMGHSDPQIAAHLGCEYTTIRNHIGRKRDRRQLSPAEMQDLFQQIETHRNMEVVMDALSGSTEQARLRASFRLGQATGKKPSGCSGAEKGSRDERVRREVEALVGHPIFDQDGPQPD